MSSSTEANAFAMSNPSLIYLIFTVALAHLSGYKSRLQQARTNYHSNHRRSSLHYRAASPYPTTSIPIISFSSPPATPRQRTAPSLPTTHTLLTPQQQTQQLQTQLHLMNCLDALKSIGTTWELARRCWRTLDQLIDKEGMKPGGTGMRDREPSLVEVGGSVQSHGLGKRKREGDEVDNRLRTPAVPEKIQVRTSSVNSPESAHAMDCASDSESSFLGGPYTPRAFDVLQGTPLRVREDSDNLHMADWTKSQTTHQTQHTVYPGSGFDMPFFSNGWLSDFETEFLDVGVAGGALDVGTMETGGWGLPVDSWNGWVGDSAWEDKFFWGKGVESGLDTG
ncbi:hypothetical protein BDP27DRAFT_255695 [Rhodocollybia butyracea]|uniref:Uncharacterized protein n=1 Tax=Rhodocollybia butyracea TaxID=206335 RepID=A0A9P5PCC1_9AGAR|nr:hypothetical protein BDP27DRAFT_255695 [Rhodocollybia butyracea]